jgi:hypothetical protein
MLTIIVPTSCSKDDPYDIDKTYAADDFVKTDRNIREKLVGKWLIEEMETSSKIYSAQELGSAHNAWFRADGSCDFLSLPDARWSVEDLRVIITYVNEETRNRQTFETYGVGKWDAWHVTLTSTSRTIKLYHQ